MDISKLFDNVNVVDTSRRQKAERTITGLLKAVKTFAIIGVEKPYYGDEKTDSEWRKIRKQFEDDMKNSAVVFYKTKGRYFSKDENSYIIYNISLSHAKAIGEIYLQDSFIFANVKDYIEDYGGVNVEYTAFKARYFNRGGHYEVIDYVATETVEDVIILEENVDNDYTAVSRKFKFRIPFTENAFCVENEIVYEDNINEVTDWVNEKLETDCSYKFIYDENIKRIISDNLRGIDKYAGRIKLYGEFLREKEQ